MVTFSFNITHNNKENNSNKQRNLFTIIKKHIIGIVHINIDGCYYINVNNETIPIFYKCYTNIKQNKLYSRELLDNKRLCVIKNKKSLSTFKTNKYLPFAPGCIVEGNIIKDNKTNTLFFDIKKIKTEYENKEAKEAFLFWKNNYDKIKNNINE